LWLNLERTLYKRRRKVVARRQQLKKSSICRGRWLKGRQVFFRKNRVTP